MTTIAPAPSALAGRLPPSRRGRDLRLAAGFLLRLLHRRLGNGLGSPRRAIILEAVLGLLGSAAYLVVLDRAITSSSDLVTVPAGLLLAYVIGTIVVSAAVMSSAAWALTGSDRETESLLLPLPLDPAMVRLAITGIPLTLAAAMASLPAMALTSVYLESADPAAATRFLLLLAALVCVGAFILATAALLQLATAMLTRSWLGQLGVPLAGVVVAGSSVALAAVLGGGLTETPQGFEAANRVLTRPAGALGTLLGVCATSAVAFGSLARALRIDARPSEGAVAVLTRRPLRAGMASLELRRFVRQPNVVATVGLAGCLLLAGVGLRVAGLPGSGGLPALALALLPFAAVYSLPAGATTDWMLTVSPVDARVVLRTRLATAAGLLSVGAVVVGGVGETIGGMGLLEVAEASPAFALSLAVSFWVGGLGGETLHDPTASLGGYLLSVVASVGFGALLVRVGLLASTASAIGVILVALVSLVLLAEVLGRSRPPAR